MITVRVFSATGELIGPVSLEIRKSDAAYRLQQALFAKNSGVVPADLERLDVGSLPLARLATVYTAPEIKGAIVRHAGALRKSAAAADEILAKVESENLWERGGLRKSKLRASDEAAEALAARGYKDVSGKGQHYARQDGHTCSVKSDGSWSHSGATGRVMSGRNVDELKRFLASVHRAI